MKAEKDNKKINEENLLTLTEELRRSNEKLSYFEKAIHNMQIGLTITDTEGKIIYCNPAEADMHQYKTDELVGRDVRIFAPKETWKPMEKSKLKMIGSFKRETMNVRKDGSLFPVQLLSDVVYDDHGEPLALVSTSEDISERKKAEREIKSAYRFLQELIDTIPNPVFYKDVKGRYLGCNKAFEDNIGKGKDEIVGKTVYDMGPKDLADKYFKMDEDLFEKGEGGKQIYEGLVISENGSRHNVVFNKANFNNSDGSVGGLVGVILDITDLKKVEKELEKSRDDLEVRIQNRTVELTAANLSLKEEIAQRTKVEGSLRQSENEYRTLFQQFSTLLNAIPDSLILFSKDMKILWANEGASTIFSLEKKPAVGEYYAVVDQLYDERDNWPVRRCFESGKNEMDEVTANDGKRINIRAFPIVDAEGNVSNVLELLSDVSEMVSLQAEAMRAGHLASIGELSAGVAHEINNPINGIINCAQLVLNRCNGNEKLEELAGMIIKEGKRISKIVEALLSFARNRGGKALPVDLNEVLSDSLALTEAHLRKDGIALCIDFPSDLPQVAGNDQQIQQVFLNLINNARYALNQRSPDRDEEKFLEINAKLVKIKKKGYVRVSFYDNGPGISSKILRKVIDPFFSTKPSKEGTGLGLSISHGIINDHGGRLSIDSKEDSYTKVVLDLPLKEDK